MNTAILVQACNRKEFTRKTVEHLLKVSGDNFHLVLVDNGSKDGTQEYLRGFIGRPNTDVVLLERNYGRDRPRSWFLDTYKDKFRYLGFLSNDVFVSPGWVDDFVAMMEAIPGIGVLGPVDREWGDRELRDNGGWKFYGGKHFYWSDAYWLLRSNVIRCLQYSTIEKVDKVKLQQPVKHPGYFFFNNFARSQEWYWDSIQNVAYFTACHPKHSMEFVWKSFPEYTRQHKLYTLLHKHVYCLDPRKYLQDTAGPMRFRMNGEDNESVWEDEPYWVANCPEDFLTRPPSQTLAQLDKGATKEDLSMLKEDEWRQLTVDRIYQG